MISRQQSLIQQHDRFQSSNLVFVMVDTLVINNNLCATLRHLIIFDLKIINNSKDLVGYKYFSISSFISNVVYE